MRLSQWFTLMLSGLAVAAAHAQGYKWIDSDGHVKYGDTPPPGVKATPLGPPPPPPISATSPSGSAGNGGAAGASTGPLTPAQQELEFRRRIKEAQEAAAKADKEHQAAEDKKQNCANAQEALRTLESGQRIMRTDENGERYYVSDEQRAADEARARRGVSDYCN
ncbi:MAG TPA: DUF4124 domain-containing protein [Burkholderiales bacterium]|nr:DUF4124 domain-containing protein [Burkholderiales bacterium]HYA47630.1 DUF4124 domain-containing protein [Burkholderiales bacterium]